MQIKCARAAAASVRGARRRGARTSPRGMTLYVEKYRVENGRIGGAASAAAALRQVYLGEAPAPRAGGPDTQHFTGRQADYDVRPSRSTNTSKYLQ
ncbi:hypothetical protein EVAR_78274_1 [Eumeta japonica]|uniref:Uncharacterized protein n=1 Tax=Eumeta variegata TaxID=151549 RepID=A0A4C1T5M9_EUMVA|nr:hypothetical protein EVAR_78274_1 [Eumeta japonica]